jgi:hypothetical protein
MQYSRTTAFAIACVALHLFFDLSIAGDVVVKGTTLVATPDGGSGSFQYSLLANVKIQAFRGGPIFKDPKSSGDGNFEFRVPEGGPFDVVFFLDPDKVPQMQSLAGAPNVGHQFHVCLLTVEQYRELEKRGLLPPLELRLRMIYDLARGEEELTYITKEMIRRIEKK